MENLAFAFCEVAETKQGERGARGLREKCEKDDASDKGEKSFQLNVDQQEFQGPHCKPYNE